MNVADQLQQIGVFLAENSFISALKQMTALLVSAVEVLGIGLLEPLHVFGKGRLGTLEQQMNVIGHQTIRIDRDPVFPPIVGESFQVDSIVAVLQKGLLRVIFGVASYIWGRVLFLDVW